MSDRIVGQTPAPLTPEEHGQETGSRPPARAAYRGTISYHTFDEVNLDTLRSLAEALGLHVEHCEPRDGLGRGPALLIDADFWWADHAERRRGLQALARREVRPPVVGLHGRQLDDEQVAALKRLGFHVSNKLDHDFVAELAKRVAGIPPAHRLPRPL
jgi:hypothetical protein